MGEEPKEKPDDIEGILADLDSILSGLTAEGPAQPVEPAPPPVPVKPPETVAPPKAAEPAKPVAAPKPVEASKPVEPAKPVEPPKPVAAPKPAKAPEPIVIPEMAAPPAPAVTPQPEPSEPRIELAPREGTLSPSRKPAPKAEPPKPSLPLSRPPLEISLNVPAAEAAKPEPKAEAKPEPKAEAKPEPKPAPKPAPEPAPKAAPPPAATPKGPAPREVPTAAGDIPPATPKDQIRRVVFAFQPSCAEARDDLAAFLSQAARTISKKPLFLREVLNLEITPQVDPETICQKARAVKAVALLVVVEGWPSAKTEALSEACARCGLLFRSVPPADVQKKSTAVDVIVDMMLLAGEA